MTAQERLNRRLKVTDAGCHEWTGYNQRGYGQIRRGARADGVVQTHRLAWELMNGPIPDGIHVLHQCDNPPCCNVEHLFLGTQAENNADKIAKGRDGNQNKTHCPHGHEYDMANTYVSVSGRRNCRACRLTYQIRYRAKLAQRHADAGL